MVSGMKHTKTWDAYFLMLAVSLVLPGCVGRSVRKTERRKLIIPTRVHASTGICMPIATHIDASSPIALQAPPITIWVHGTRAISRRIMRTFSYALPGLHLATSIEKKYHLRSIAETLAQIAPEKYPLETFYLFGWSGQLLFAEREEAAKRLYKELKEVIAQYEKKHGATPRIQIITHSHGGNVVLNLAKVKDAIDTELAIDELVLLACPVQAKTMQFIQSPIFQYIYSLYSSLDIIQVIAPQFYYTKQEDGKIKRKFPLFSSRQFPPQSNLAQMKIKLNGRAVWHTEFVLHHFLRILPATIAHMAQWQQEDQQYTRTKVDTRRLISVYTNKWLYKNFNVKEVS